MVELFDIRVVLSTVGLVSLVIPLIIPLARFIVADLWVLMIMLWLAIESRRPLASFVEIDLWLVRGRRSWRLVDI